MSIESLQANRLAKVFLLTGLGASSLLAQSDSGVLVGVVKDPTDTRVFGAKVNLKNRATSNAREATSDARGLFYFRLLPPGDYELRVEAAGFKVYANQQVKVNVAEVSRIDVALQLGATTESIEVSADVSPLNAETVSQGTVVTGEKIPAIPLNGRQFLQLVLLVPGVNPGGRAVQQNAIRQGQIGGISIAGGRTNNTAFLLDGAVNLDPDYNSLNYSPAIDAIAEFQVQTAMVGAEYGRASVNVVTKSGSNDVHGAAWEFLRNRAVDARPFNLNSALPQFQRNQFGGNIGGPIVKNRLMYFFAYEGLRVHQAGAGLTTVVVPGELQRRGDFSQTKGGIFDPDTLASGVRAPFPNNVIPASRINPLSLAAVQALPLPVDARTNSYVNANGLLQQNNNNYSGRADFNATRNWHLFGRYSVAQEDAAIPQTVPGRDALNDGRSQNGTIGSTHVLSSTMVNETRLGFSRLNLLTGLPELSFPINGTPRTLPQFNVSGYPLMGGAGGFNTTNAGGGISQVRNNVLQLYDNLSWIRGKHALKFGGEVSYLQYNRFEAAAVLGNFQFTNGFTTRTAKNDGTGDALASMLLALPAVGNRAVGPSRIDGRQKLFAGYFQDDFHIRSNVTLNIGVRYEVAPPIYDARQQMSSIDYHNVPSPADVFASGKTGFYKPTLFVCGQSGYPKGCANTDYNNIAPRAGVVWAVQPKTVVRAGGGVFYANTDANPLFRLAAGLPTNIAQTLNSDNFVPRFSGYDIFGPAIAGPVQIQAAGLDINQRTSYQLQWNLSVQREFAKSTVLEIGYLATAGLKLEQNVQPNNAQPGVGAVDPRRPYLGVVYADGTRFPNYLTVVGNNVPVGFINYLPHSAQSNYQSGYLRFERRFNSGFSFLSSYTFAKSITNAPQFRNAGGVTGSENSPPQDSYNLQAERGLASFHVSHRWVSTGLYDLPFGKGQRWVKEGLTGKILGGFQLSSVYTMQTGFPYTINLRGDSAGVGAGTGGIFIRPNAVPGVEANLSGTARSTDRWFNTGAFSTPPTAAFGNLGKNTMIGPGLVNLDLVIAKNIHVNEHVRLQFRGEFFNALNHSNYNIVGRILNDPTFGRVQSQLDPRQLQFGLKALF